MSAPELRPEVLAEIRRLGGDALVRRLLRLFVQGSEDAPERIRGALSAGQPAIARAAAHHLYSSAAQLQLEEVAARADAMVTAVESGDRAAAERAWAELAPALDAARAAARRVLAALPEAPRVAVVEDSEDVRLLLRLMLERDFDLAEYPDGESALAGMRRAAPDLAIIDFTLPDMDGLELLRRIRQDGAIPGRVQAVALTALQTVGGRSLTEQGFALHISKPILDADALVRDLSSLLQEPGT